MSPLQIIKDYSNALWTSKDINAIDQFFHENALVHSPIETTQGTAKMKSIIQEWFQGFPNLKVYWDDFICEDNKVVSRWHAEGKHEGEFLGRSPSHKTVKYAGVTIYALENGKVNDYWAFIDMQSIFKQLDEN